MEEICGSSFRLLIDNPSHVVRSSILPSGLKFVTEGPHEVTLDELVPSLDSTLTKFVYITVFEEERVARAFSVLHSR